MEHNYEEQCRRLAEDWQRLEKQQQDSLTTLHQKEIELQKRKLELELERQEELAIVSLQNQNSLRIILFLGCSNLFLNS